ncbi:MAG: hypothetical protein ACJ74U_12250 [Jatrophihabitantaceae bacterium]
MTAYHLQFFAMLAALSVSYLMLVRRTERLRRGLTDGYVAHSLDIWIMAGVLLLPFPLLTALVALVYLAEWPSRKIVAGGRPKRYAISGAINLLAALSAAEVHAISPGLGGLPAVIVTWSAVNDILIAAVMVVGGSRTGIRRLLSPRNHVFDLATKLVGVVLALLLNWQAPLAVVVVPLLLLGHRIALRDSIRETAAFDPATGLWSEEGWRIQAEQVVAHAPASVVLVLIDPALPDREDAIHATVAGLFGSARLAASTDNAPPVRHVTGRYGTRQVALISEVDVAGAGVLLAKHVRDRLRSRGIACVVGAAVGCADFDELLIRAGEDLMSRRAQAGVSARW